jgi:hypothetical protein
MAILLNNGGVDELEAGNTVRAVEMLSHASSIIQHPSSEHTDHNEDHTYRYRLVGFASAYRGQEEYRSRGESPQQPWSSHSEEEILSPFLCLSALKVSISPGHEDTLDSLCPCGYAWVIWYNLAFAYILLGARRGGEQEGQRLLTQAYTLLRRVQLRVDAEPPSKSWSFLQMAVANNQICLTHELEMLDEWSNSLERLASFLNKPQVIEKQDWDRFSLTLVILNAFGLAPAA